MPTRLTPVLGAPTWVDLQTSDPERARSFYSEVLGWTALEASEEFGGYFMFTSGDMPVSGCMRSDAQAPVPDVWSVYLASGDVEKTLATASERGGQVVVPPMPVADLGTMAFLIDSTGAAIGVWQPGTFHGFGLLDEPGAPAWFELRTRDLPEATRFYCEVFGWQTEVMSDTDEFRYTLMVDGGTQYAGVMDAATFLPDAVPPHWTVYFRVENTDAAVETLLRLGGTVVEPAADSPYGRIAEVTDPMGASFRIAGG